ncbi:MAG: DNA/RNA non-specific endonuclease [Cyclobacteriaceae bacterium]|nr:DNA/RNA non-specific endonuclease [Cyclobacteriaceae bacterium]
MDKKSRRQDLRELRLQLESKAADRWNKRQEFRKDPTAYLQKNVLERMKMEQRYANYNQRELKMAPVVLTTSLESARTFERKIGDTLDLSRRPTSAAAYKFGRPVGRIFQVPDPGVEIDAFGTGFLIAPNLLLTNQHVFPSVQHASGCAVNFGYEYDEFNKLQMGTKFILSPDKFFLCCEPLDFAIVYVESMDDRNSTNLSDLGFIPLIATAGKVVLNDPLNIVQYPLGKFKQYSTINNLVKDILEAEGFIQYTTDTLESSSGSPAANKHWEVAAVHHSGIAMTVDGKVWSKFNRPWDLSMSDEDKIYIANEGVSISRIVQYLEQVQLNSPAEQALLNTVLTNSVDKVLENSPVISVTESGTAKIPTSLSPIPLPESAMNNSKSQNVFNFYNTAHVQIITSTDSNAASIHASVTPQPTQPKGSAAQEKKLRFDEVYSNRRSKGYKPNFLGIKIPTPEVANSRLKEIYCKPEGVPLILKYYHFSLVMNATFRLQMWSAVNVDYDPALKTSRDRKEFGNEANSWRLDPRIPEEIQITDSEFYKPATQVDRGHMVRRDDSCYGQTELEIEYANSDTFHWTNCTPQHEGFNQSRQYGVWGMLENAIKEGLSSEDTKASIFVGPVLIADEDRIYKDIYYPVKFWKVVAALDDKGELRAYGFMLDQTKIVDRRGLEAKFDFTKFKAQQMSLARIEKEAQIVFPKVLKDADVLTRNGRGEEVIELESKDNVVINVKKSKKES